MRARIKQRERRLEAVGAIQEILIREDIMHPDREIISLCFRGPSGSGIIDLKTDEFERIAGSIKTRLIKDVTIIR